MQEIRELRRFPKDGEIASDFFKKFFKNFENSVLTSEALDPKQLLLVAIMVQRARQIRLFSVPKFLDTLGIALPMQDNDGLRTTMERAVRDVTVSADTLANVGFSTREITYLLSLLPIGEPKRDDREVDQQPKHRAGSATPKRKVRSPSTPPFRGTSGLLAKAAETSFNKFLVDIKPSQQSIELAATIVEAVIRGGPFPTRDWLVVQQDKSGKISIVIFEDRNYENKSVGAPLGEAGGQKALELARALQESDFSAVPVICTVSFEPRNSRTLAQSFQVVAHMPTKHSVLS
jgi:hypothetical protein